MMLLRPSHPLLIRFAGGGENIGYIRSWTIILNFLIFLFSSWLLAFVITYLGRDVQMTVALRLLDHRHSAQCDHLGYTHPHSTSRTGAFTRLYQSSNDAE